MEAWRFRLWIGVLVAGLGGLAGIAWLHRSYYLAPLAEQALDPRHAVLRSSGRLGLVLGLVGTVVIFLNLTYLVRRRLIRWQWPGSLRSWMDFHVASGVLGAGCILLHSGLGTRSALGTVAAAALGIVVAAGLIGRYLFAHVPRSIEGRELRFDELLKEYEALRTFLEKRGVDLDLEEVRAAAPPRSKLRAFLGILLGDPELRRLHRAKRQQIRASGAGGRAARVALRRLFKEQQWIRRYDELRTLMASWRFLHRWLALVMLGTVAFHIALAVIYGRLWILGGQP